MEIEIAGLAGFVSALTAVIALIYERQTNVLNGPHIERPFGCIRRA